MNRQALLALAALGGVAVVAVAYFTMRRGAASPDGDGPRPYDTDPGTRPSGVSGTQWNASGPSGTRSIFK